MKREGRQHSGIFMQYYNSKSGDVVPCISSVGCPRIHLSLVKKGAHLQNWAPSGQNQPEIILTQLEYEKIKIKGFGPLEINLDKWAPCHTTLVYSGTPYSSVSLIVFQNCLWADLGLLTVCPVCCLPCVCLDRSRIQFSEDILSTQPYSKYHWKSKSRAIIRIRPLITDTQTNTFNKLVMTLIAALGKGQMVQPW